MMEFSWVQQSPILSGIFQHWQHDLGPQGSMKSDNLLDVAEELGGLHLHQQATLLQVQQPTQKQLENIMKCLMLVY